jgi:AcrR family transcriptional regulator
MFAVSTFMLDCVLVHMFGDTSLTRTSYHHGDLYSSLVAAAESLLEQKGVAGVSLREVCQCAGVSHAAPYRHFRDKAALLEAIAKDGFERLGVMLREARTRFPSEPEDQLREAGLAYVYWATDNPERTRLMFGGMMKSEDVSPSLRESADSAYAEIWEIIDAGRRSGAFGGADTDSVVICAWSAVHGLTMLILGTGKISPSGRDQIRALAETVCETILLGLRSRD